MTIGGSVLFHTTQADEQRAAAFKERVLEPHFSSSTMTCVPVFVLFLVTTTGFALSQNSASPVTYRVTFSSRMRPGMTLPVSVHLLQDGDSAEVFVTLRNIKSKAVKASASSLRVYGGGNPQVINMIIPRKLDDEGDDPKSAYEVRVKAIGDVNFDEVAQMTLEEQSFSIFIQTDKAIYKPGQTVMMRILAMNPDLSVLKAPMDVVIKDPKDNLVRQWKQVKEDRTGVVELSMPTSTNPILGNWTIQARILDLNETQIFMIDKYVLPKFEASVHVPKKVLITNEIKGTASAKYTFGKPLTEADVSVVVRLQTTTSAPNISSTGKLDSKGEFAFSFTNAQLLALSSQTFNWQSLESKEAEVIVLVTEESTGHHMDTTATVAFEKYKAKVEFLPITTSSFKPGLPYTVYLSVTKYDGTFFPTSESVNITFVVTTTQDTKTISTVQNLQLNGLLRVQQAFPRNAEKISIQAQMKDYTARKSVDKAYSPSGNFLKVVMDSPEPEVGKNVKFTAFATENVPQIFVQVYTKGIMVNDFLVRSSSQQGDEQFPISFLVEDAMAPNARLLVFYFRPDKEVVADSISFKVKGSSDNPISVKYTDKKVKPGEKVSLKISAKSDSSVFLLAVDKSVQAFERWKRHHTG
ncbi:CD109 antigen-like isoform X1 [Pomacea canaliculata]|uniref:CD109 antigen-like isoform X1 n=1 Tax=Pomacea canaliculata TaxID=400727 RepID=UPI000D734E35|nr:CD109 antigen-like isoform X1 [Pomacea canaliculata]